MYINDETTNRCRTGRRRNRIRDLLYGIIDFRNIVYSQRTVLPQNVYVTHNRPADYILGVVGKKVEIVGRASVLCLYFFVAFSSFMIGTRRI